MTSTRTLDGIQAFLSEVGIEQDLPDFPLADIEANPMAIYTCFVANTLVQLTGCAPDAAWAAVQRPGELGDFAVVVPRLRLQDVKPAELADVTLQLQKTFPPSLLFEHPFQDGINLRFFFKAHTLARILLAYIIDRGEQYGLNPSLGLRDAGNPEAGRKRVIVEYSSPNIGKGFDGYHSRSTVLGAHVASLLEGMGWDVVRMNFIGDWGKHIGLLAAGCRRFQSDEQFQSDPMGHLLDIFRQIDALYQTERSDPSFTEGSAIDGEKDDFFRRLEDHEPEAMALWQQYRDVFTSRYARLYERMGLAFDDDSGESACKQETISRVEEALREKGLYEESDGAWIINFEKHNVPGTRNVIARFRNGTTSYLLRDIAAFYERREKHAFDLMIYVASAQQNAHFHQLFKALEMLGNTGIDTQLKHLSIGKMQAETAPARDSGILLEDILDQCSTAVQTLSEVDPECMAEFFSPPDGIDNASSVSASLAHSCLLVHDLSHKHSAHLTVDATKIATTKGHTGIVLQQWYWALRERLRGAIVTREELDGASLSIFEREEYADVLRVLIQFPDVLKTACRQPSFESAGVVTYLFRLTDALGQIWDEQEGGPGEAGSSSSGRDIAELALLECVRLVLGNGMRVLGIRALEP